MKHLFKTTQSEYEEICQSLAIPHVAHTLDTYNIEWESDKDIVTVEYLQSDGNQYIDMGVIGNLDTELEVSFNASEQLRWIAGCKDSSNTASISLYIGSLSTSSSTAYVKTA